MTIDDLKAQGSANPGRIRPPLVYICAIVLGVLLHFLWPVRLLPRALGVPLGISAELAAIILFVSAVRTFRSAGTPVPGNLPTTTTVRTGPYRFSRKPCRIDNPKNGSGGVLLPGESPQTTSAQSPGQAQRAPKGC